MSQDQRYVRITAEAYVWVPRGVGKTRSQWLEDLEDDIGGLLREALPGLEVETLDVRAVLQ